jgi:hypothetical protein
MAKLAFSHARWPEQDDVAALFDEAQRGEFGEHFAVQRGLEVEVELGQRLVDRVAREAEPTAHPPGVGGVGFEGEQALQHLGG